MPAGSLIYGTAGARLVFPCKLAAGIILLASFYGLYIRDKGVVRRKFEMGS